MAGISQLMRIGPRWSRRRRVGDRTVTGVSLLAMLCSAGIVGCSHGDGTGSSAATTHSAPSPPVRVDVQRRPVGAGLSGALYAPQRRSTPPAVVLLGGSDGQSPTAAARALAQSGHEALALAYFGAPQTPSSLCGVPIEYFAHAVSWLSDRADSAVVVIGISRGSEAAILLAADRPQDLAGVVAVAPTAAVEAGVCRSDGGGAAWTLDGRAIPHLPPYNFAEAPPIERRFRLPVDRLGVPLLAIGAGADQVWPSGDYAAELGRTASSAARAGPGRVLAFPHAGHGIGCFAPECSGRTSLDGRPLGGTRAANERAQDQTLMAIVSFLDALRSS